MIGGRRHGHARAREREDHLRKIIALAAGLAMLALAAPGLQPFARPLASRSSRAAAGDTLLLSLEESVRLAVANNSGLRITREKVSEAGAAVDEARAAFLPQLTGSAGYTRLDTAPYIPSSRLRMFGGSGSPADGAVPDRITIGLRDNYAASLELRQPLFAAGRIKNTYDISRLAGSAAESELDRTTADLIFETKKAYLECIEAQELEKVARETVRQLEAHLNDLQAMFGAGLAATNDVLKTKVYHSDAKLTLIKARHAIHLADKRLCNIIDVPLTTEIILTSRVDTAAAVAIDLDAAVEAAIARRPELASIEYRRLMMEKEIEIERNGYLPTVALFAKLGYQYPDREYERSFYSSWALGVTAEMNVFDWGETVYRARQSKSRLRQIEIAAQSLRESITLDVTRTYLTLLDAWSGISVARENATQAEENYRVTNEKFKEGLATNTDLLDAEVLLVTAKTSYSNLVIAYMVARADHERATGGTEN